MTDTAGVSDMVFGLFWHLGYQLSPRLADAGEAVFWRLDKDALISRRDAVLLSTSAQFASNDLPSSAVESIVTYFCVSARFTRSSPTEAIEPEDVNCRSRWPCMDFAYIIPARPKHTKAKLHPAMMIISLVLILNLFKMVTNMGISVFRHINAYALFR